MRIYHIYLNTHFRYGEGTQRTCSTNLLHLPSLSHLMENMVNAIVPHFYFILRGEYVVTMMSVIEKLRQFRRYRETERLYEMFLTSFFLAPEMGLNWEKLGEKIEYTQRTRKSQNHLFGTPWFLCHWYLHIIHLGASI